MGAMVMDEPGLATRLIVKGLSSMLLDMLMMVMACGFRLVLGRG